MSLSMGLESGGEPKGRWVEQLELFPFSVRYLATTAHNRLPDAPMRSQFGYMHPPGNPSACEKYVIALY